MSSLDNGMLAIKQTIRVICLLSNRHKYCRGLRNALDLMGNKGKRRRKHQINDATSSLINSKPKNSLNKFACRLSVSHVIT